MGLCSLCRKSEDEEIMDNYMNDLAISQIYPSELYTFVYETINNKSADNILITIQEKYFDLGYLTTLNYNSFRDIKPLLFSLCFLCKKDIDKVCAYLEVLDKQTQKKFLIEGENEILISKHNLDMILNYYYQLVSSHLLIVLEKKFSDLAKTKKKFDICFSGKYIQSLINEILYSENNNISLRNFIKQNLNTYLDQGFIRNKQIESYNNYVMIKSSAEHNS